MDAQVGPFHSGQVRVENPRTVPSALPASKTLQSFLLHQTILTLHQRAGREKEYTRKSALLSYGLWRERASCSRSLSLHFRFIYPKRQKSGLLSGSILRHCCYVFIAFFNPSLAKQVQNPIAPLARVPTITMSAAASSIQVTVRVRPFTIREAAQVYVLLFTHLRLGPTSGFTNGITVSLVTERNPMTTRRSLEREPW